MQKGVAQSPHNCFMASFTEEVKSRLAKCPLDFNGRLANHGLTLLGKEANDVSVVMILEKSIQSGAMIMY